MGLFLRITYQSQGGRTVEKAFINRKVLSYIIDGLNDGNWQDSISIKLTTLDPQYSHIAIDAILRFFLSENIEGGNLKSFYRYLKKDDKLIIDQMLTIDKYDDLSEDETRKALCDDIFLYFKDVILKYKDRFLDFNAVAFIPLLEERFGDIKNGKLINTRKYDSY
ncbi:hypothetical protein FYJ30_23480 [Bacteroides vulgatus]|uniref:Uncharacterized protein n=2 Tax=Bacteroidaceae TaxID=815 RepID=A0A7K0JM94_PHOVU|nr:MULTISPECIES: hypothetical protein [Bacteroidaceae]MSS51141.1 hypothetical protein [Phocaeicola vulgatus]NME88041.1 hypothetical protein [Bacteroides eggerthii]